MLDEGRPRSDLLSARKLAAVAMVVGGALCMFQGKFSYASASPPARTSALQVAVKEGESSSLLVWLGMAAMAAGGLLLYLPRRRE